MGCHCVIQRFDHRSRGRFTRLYEGRIPLLCHRKERRLLIGRTKLPARGGRPAVVALKLTLLNPNATATDIEDLLDQVVATGLDVLTGEGAA